MAIPSREIGWSNESNLLWGIAKQMQQLNGILGNGGCCGGASGCITHTDITWDALNAGNAAGTLQDCFYNVIDRPNSGTDPLYVLAEGGRVDLDNEVVRQQAAVGSLCIDSLQEGLGCFNIYAESTSYTVEYVPGVEVIQMRIDAKLCSDFSFAVGDTVTQTDPIASPTPTGTIVFIGAGNEFGDGCNLYVEVTSGTWDFDGTLTNGVDTISFSYRPVCNDPSPLAVGTEVVGIQSIPTYPQPKGTITAISGTSITITPIQGDWNGVVVFAVINEKEGTICFYTLTAPIVSVSTQLNSETICWDAASYLGYGVYLNTLMQATDGLIYGTLQEGYEGLTSGQLFSLDPITNTVNVLFEFTDSANEGSEPSSGLIEIAGELYGTCANGGDYSVGTIWKWNIATKTFTKLYDINDGNGDGAYPYGGLVNVGGQLWGTCENGGANSVGTIWSWEIATDTFTKLADFDDTDPIAYPQGPLVEVNPGELWGTSYQGGTNNNGTIFKYTISSGLLEIVINLNDVPNIGVQSVGGASGGVSLGSDGNVYFNTNYGGADDAGTICQITDVATTPTLNVLYEFNGISEFGGFDASCPIYIDGNLYGFTNEYFGPFQPDCLPYGNLYKLNITLGILTTLHNFTTTDGTSPYLGQLFPIGNELFGMTNGIRCRAGGTTYGQIFKYNIVTDEYTNIHKLNSQAQTSANIATSICNSITNPDYLCHTVGNCVYIDGPAGINGYTLVLKTVVTYTWCRKNNTDPGNCDPTIGDHLYNNDDGLLIGTIQTVTITSTSPEAVCGTMTVELANNDYLPIPEFTYYIDETGCVGGILEETGTNLSYEVTPFAGGFEPVNLPCYYNVPFDVITEYPLSQKLTKAEIDYLVVNNLLIPGTSYRIIDADFFLYGGTEIVIQAVAPDKFSDIGMGKFYTPKYNQEIAGYGIWDAKLQEDGFYAAGDTAIWGGLVWTKIDPPLPEICIIDAPSAYTLNYGCWTIPGRIKITISGATGTFLVGDAVYGYDGGAYGIITEVGTDYLIVMAPPSFFAYPTWETSHVIYDDDSGVEAIMDSVTLHADYFSDLIYNVRWDEIKYDYTNDFISYRKDNSGNSVNQERWEYDDWGAGRYRNILGMQWGNEFNDSSYRGIGSNTVIGIGYVEIINFTGGYITNNTFINSTLLDCFFSPGNNSIYNNFLSSSWVSQLELNGSGSFNYNTFTNGTTMYLLRLGNAASFYKNTLSNCILTLTGITGDIAYLNGNGVNKTANLIAATIIYGNYSKDLLFNAGGGTVLRYINGSNVQVITAITT